MGLQTGRMVAPLAASRSTKVRFRGARLDGSHAAEQMLYGTAKHAGAGYGEDAPSGRSRASTVDEFRAAHRDRDRRPRWTM